jgi:hypothetical protein
LLTLVSQNTSPNAHLEVQLIRRVWHQRKPGRLPSSRMTNRDKSTTSRTTRFLVELIESMVLIVNKESIRLTNRG